MSTIRYNTIAAKLREFLSYRSDAEIENARRHILDMRDSVEILALISLDPEMDFVARSQAARLFVSAYFRAAESMRSLRNSVDELLLSVDSVAVREGAVLGLGDFVGSDNREAIALAEAACCDVAAAVRDAAADAKSALEESKW